MQPMDKIMVLNIPGFPWETIGTKIFILNNITYLCKVDYHSKLPIVKVTKGLPAHHLIKSCKIIFTEHRLPKKLMSDAHTNFVSEKILRILHEVKDPTCCIITIQPLKQWTDRRCIEFVKETMNM